MLGLRQHWQEHGRPHLVLEGDEEGESQCVLKIYPVSHCLADFSGCGGRVQRQAEAAAVHQSHRHVDGPPGLCSLSVVKKERPQGICREYMALASQCSLLPPALCNKALPFSLHWPLSGAGAQHNSLHNHQALFAQKPPNTARHKKNEVCK